MNFKNIILFSFIFIFFITKLSVAMSNNILLQCSSVKFFDDIWIGNILHVKIDEEKNRVYLNEPADKKIGWTMNKLTSVKADFFTFENCENIKCENSSFAYYSIDRVVGSLKYYTKVRKNDKYTKMYEYQCKKIKRAF
jgi:hypothetical protein